MVKRICALLAVFILLITGSSLADLKLRDKTPAQKMLATYIGNVNEFLADNGEMELNRIFDEQNSVVELGMTSSDEDFEPDVVVDIYMRYDSLHYLVLRVNSTDRFPAIAGAFLRALNPKTMTQEESLKTPAERARKAAANPNDSFSDHEFDIYAEKEQEILNGEKPQSFYAYYPNQYHNGENWLQLMIIFPLDGYWNEESGVINDEAQPKTPDRDSDQDKEYDGYYATDDYEHLRIFTTATPEPDSAAAEYDEFFK